MNIFLSLCASGVEGESKVWLFHLCQNCRTANKDARQLLVWPQSCKQLSPLFFLFNWGGGERGNGLKLNVALAVYCILYPHGNKVESGCWLGVAEGFALGLKVHWEEPTGWYSFWYIDVPVSYLT